MTASEYTDNAWAVTAWYNEIDPQAAAWLRSLIAAGLIAPGVVDERSIADVRPADLASFRQVHFFAGIGGWPYALRLAGWPDDKPVWTGSCPCQPLSSAGQQRGHADERHLWPAFHRLVAECRPATVFGEQVASRLGREWLAGVRADLEELGYAVGAADLCAASVGAPHIRQRLFWVADAGASRRRALQWPSGADGRSAVEPDGLGPAGGLGDAGITGLEGHAGHGDNRGEPGRLTAHTDGPVTEAGATGAWSDFYVIACADGKARRVGSGLFPLAHGVSARVGRLRGYGNAIVPQVAAQFVTAFQQARAA